jgi:hypothetical protein
LFHQDALFEHQDANDERDVYECGQGGTTSVAQSYSTAYADVPASSYSARHRQGIPVYPKKKKKNLNLNFLKLLIEFRLFTWPAIQRM